MKKLSLLAGAAAFAASAFAADSSWVRFSSEGPDRYADGTVVLDNEVYALVWVRDGAAFEGLQANGELVNAEDNKIVAQAAIAKDGRCPRVCYIIQGDNLDLVGNGAFEVYLFDTRVKSDAGETAAGVKGADGRFVSYNACEKVDANVAVASSTVAEDGSAAGAASVASVLPEDTPNPVIEAIDVDPATGKVLVKVSNTKPYVKYAIAAGEKIGSIDTNLANGVNGVEGGVILLTVDDPQKNRFFKVERSK